MAKSGNPNPKNQFQPGHPPSNKEGRKGYEFEESQKKKMGSLLNRLLKLIKKIEKGEADADEIKRYQILASVALKMMDKFHANKTDIKLDFDKPLLIKKAK